MAKKQKLPVAKPSTTEVAGPSPYRITQADKDRERRYKAEDGLRAIQRAEEVRQDKQLMSDVKALAKEQVKALGKIK